MGKNDFTKIPNGIPSLEERVNLLYTYGVKAGKIDLHTFVNVASTQVAKTFDLFLASIDPTRRGRRPQVAVFDPKYRGKNFRENAARTSITAPGWKLEGRPGVVNGSGEVVRRKICWQNRPRQISPT